MIWIIGGTSETADLIRLLDQPDNVIVTVATEAARQFIDGAGVVVRRMGLEQMVRFITEHDIQTVVDLSHPYAFEVSENAGRASLECSVRYMRFVRQRAEPGESIRLAGIEGCMKFLKTVEGTVFFTTGSKHIGEFLSVRQNNRFVFRVLPSVESLDICNQYGLPVKDIIAALGPFSILMNRAMFSEYQADYVVMKNSGIRGGTKEKLEACRELNVIPLLIEREDETGYDNLEVLARHLKPENKKIGT